MAVFYSEGLDFSCKRCSHCCTTEPGYVYLSVDDLEKLTSSKKLSTNEFIEKFCRWVGYYDGTEVLCLKEKPNYDCILWENDGCSAYNARPVQCRTYPFWTHLLTSKANWDCEKKDCPGINCGSHHTFEEISQNLSLYQDNKPLRREK